MNLLLLDPFEVAKEYPETLTNSLQFGHSRYIKFNDKGDYLASGLLDGTIVIFDNDTNQALITLKHHTGVIQSLQWSGCGRFILSASTDCSVLLWDLKTQTVIRELMFDSAVWSAHLHPTDNFIFICSVLNDDSVYVDWKDEKDIKISKLPNSPLIPMEENIDEDDSENDNVHKKQKKTNDFALCVTFASKGDLVFMGTSKGWLNIIYKNDDDELKVIFSQRVCNSHAKQIVVSERNNKLFINCSDRIIRQLTFPDKFIEKIVKNPLNEPLEIEHKYQDVVNRLQWNSINCNHNGDYLIASTYGSGAHDIYIWETTIGSLIKVLEGPKEELFDIDWNNKRCIIGANGLDSGFIYLWSNIIPQKWSALAPDFVEIEENIEYEEREDEFDILPEEELNQRRLNEEDEPVDIVTRDVVDARGLLEKPSFVINVRLEQELQAPNQFQDDDP